MKTILITGSTSFVCRFLVKKLLEDTSNKIVLTYRTNKGDYPKHELLIFEKANLLDPQTFQPIIEKYKPHVIIHLAAMARVADGEKYPIDVLNANLIASIEITKMAIDNDVERIITTSSNLAQDAVIVVGIGKLLVEQFYQKVNPYNSKLITLRMPNVIDSNGAVSLIFKKQIKENKPITITHPDMSRMFVTGDRAAELLLYLTDKGEHKGNYISTDKPIKIKDLATDLIEKSGKDIGIKYIGMKPGEKIIEKGFSNSEIITTGLSGLGKIRNYEYNNSMVNSVIDILNKRKAISQSKDIQDIFAFLKSGNYSN